MLHNLLGAYIKKKEMEGKGKEGKEGRKEIRKRVFEAFRK